MVNRMNLEQLISIQNSSLLPTVDEVANKLLLNARNEVVFLQGYDPNTLLGRQKIWMAMKGVVTMK